MLPTTPAGLYVGLNDLHARGHRLQILPFIWGSNFVAASLEICKAIDSIPRNVGVGGRERNGGRDDKCIHSVN